MEDSIRQDTESMPNLSSSATVDHILNITQLEDAKAAFDQHEVSDLWLPIPKQMLRRFFNDKKKENAFFEWQQSFLHTGSHVKTWLESDGNFGNLSYHAFLDDGDDHVKRQRTIGEGAFGIVEEIGLETDSMKLVCVRKTIGRPKNIGAHRQVMVAFHRELNIMRQVTHHHCVRLLGSYTDLDSVNILLNPVADMDLSAYLEQDLDRAGKEFLRRSVRCLCNAIKYLHENKIRHEDLKPQNILIHGDNILLADFGFSLDFSNDSISTTTGRPAAWTVRYAAPEVLQFEPRNRASDIFSLGCVLIEVISAYHGHKLSEVKLYWKTHGTRHASFAQNREALVEWLIKMTEYPQPSTMEYLCMFVQDLTHSDRRARCTAAVVVDRLAEVDLLMPEERGADCCAIDSSVCDSVAKIKGLIAHEQGYLNHPYCFYPSGHRDWACFTFDGCPNHRLLVSNQRYALPDVMSAVSRSSTEITRACREIWETGSRDGETREYWAVHANKTHLDKEDLTDGDVQAIILAVRSARLKHIVFKAWWDHVLLPSSGPAGWTRRLLFLSLIPITDTRSRLYGRFVFQLRFQLSPSLPIPARFLNRVIDLTDRR